MGFFDDDFLQGITDAAQSAASDAVSNVTQSAGDFISRNVGAGLVSVGAAPTGNLSQAQLDAGATGGKIPVIASQAAVATMKSPITYIVIAAIGLYFFLGRK